MPVGTNTEVAMAFASGSEREWRSAGNRMFTGGDRLYSYGTHFTIAKRERLAPDKYVYLVAEKGPSISTNGHIGLAKSALNAWLSSLSAQRSQLRRLIATDKMPAPRVAVAPDPDCVKSSVKKLILRWDKLVDKALRARACFGWRVREMEHTAVKLATIEALFRLRRTHLSDRIPDKLTARGVQYGLTEQMDKPYPQHEWTNLIRRLHELRDTRKVKKEA